MFYKIQQQTPREVLFAYQILLSCYYLSDFTCTKMSTSFKHNIHLKIHISFWINNHISFSSLIYLQLFKAYFNNNQTTLSSNFGIWDQLWI